MGFTRIGDYRGRSSRSEYWWMFLFTAVIGFALALAVEASAPGQIDPITGRYTASAASSAMQGLLSIAGLVIGLPLAVRRLHDSGKAWPYLLFGLIPFGGIVLLVFMCAGTQMTVNRWGPPPK